MNKPASNMRLYGKMKEISPKRNPILTAMHTLSDPESIESFICEYVDSLKGGGLNEQRYSCWVRFAKNPSGRHEDLAGNHIGDMLVVYKGEMDDNPNNHDSEKISLWEKSLKKLLMH